MFHGILKTSMMCPRNETELNHDKFMTNPNYKLQVPLPHSKLLPSSLTHFPSFSTMPWWSPWACGERKRSHTELARVSREVTPAWQYSSLQEIVGCSGLCEPARCPATTLTSFCTLQRDPAVFALFRHAGWLSGPEPRIMCAMLPHITQSPVTFLTYLIYMLMASSVSLAKM